MIDQGGRMRGRGALGRGMRVGMVMAGAPGLPWAVLALMVAVVELATGGDTEFAMRDLRYCGLLVAGSVVAGVFMGSVLGGGLALASRVVVRPWPLALVGALLGGLAFVAEFAVVAVGTDGGFAETAVTFLAWPVMAAVAAVHSSDIAGLTRTWAWLWGRGIGRRRGVSDQGEHDHLG
ncbi:hypothetical protein ABZ915_24865 [Streptomyces sp. NPDC046915]|uniref:hypothetical protein n=1 Tax=Streptomyces sp. NPDC046915 TaxID=3155257 RepID=UPI00340D5498